MTTNAAAVAQEVRRTIERWPEVRQVHGPLMHNPDTYFLRFIIEDGTIYAIELTHEGKYDD